jgi:serine/threonine protein kinase
MSTPTDPLDALIAAYVQAIEAGQVPNRRELLDQNPDHAEALQTFFADFDRMDRVASPLRLAGELDETAALSPIGLTQPPTVRYFGDYELLEEVARGGMGVVYKARQTSLNRLVALKMILAGTFATPREVARFQAEAEAAANLDHPHIVPVYEVGEHEGQQYFSMKFIEGGSLSSQARGEAKAEVQGLITIARAVHHAHQHGVLHRDLKPGNVLVDLKGDRHVTDFGLAKRLTDLDRSLTDPGQILGTPRYMSPEQAAGRKDLTVATDVYALGVILYERLTGRTPFDGETPLALLRQVRESEPPRPSTIRPGLDRDLETIVLKCLEKDPTRRYHSAEELAQDLTRWHEGRPINARPVGQAERFARWCRRNPAIATLSASVALALLVGTFVSTLFAYQERKARIRAEKAEDATEGAFARSLIRPLDPGGGNNTNLSEPEFEALWELASQTTESLRARFLDEAISNPSSLRQLHARSGHALIAALGLDPDRRDQASRRLFGRLEHPGLSREDKAAISFLLLEIDNGTDPRAEKALETIIRTLDDNLALNQRTALEEKIVNSCDWLSPARASALLAAAMERRTGVSNAYRLTGAIVALSGRLGSAEAAAVCGLAARDLAEAIAREQDAGGRSWLAGTLATLSGRLGSAEAAAACGPAARDLAEAIAREKDYDARSRLAGALETLSGRLGSAEAEPVARALVEAIAREQNDGARSRLDLTRALATLSGRLGSAEAEPVARAVAEAITREKDVSGLSDLAGALVALSGRLGAAEAAALCGPAARAVAEAIAREKDGDALSKLAYAFEALSGRLGAAEAEPVARAVAEAIAREKDVSGRNRWALARALATLSGRLGAAEAAAVCGPAARDLAEAIVREKDGDALSKLAYAFEALSGRLGSTEAAAVCGPAARDLAEAIAREKDANVQASLTYALEALSGRLGAAEAAAVCGPVARDLAEAITRERGVSDRNRRALAKALATLSGRLGSAEAEPVARAVAEAITREKDANVLHDLAGALVALSGRLGAAEVETIARGVAEAIAREKDANVQASLTYALEALSGRLGAAEAAAVCGPTARDLAEAIAREKGVSDRNRWALAKALGTLSGRLGAAEAEPVARAVAEAITRENGSIQSNLAGAMVTLSGRLGSAEAAAVCGPAARAVAGAIAREKDANVLYSLAGALEALSGRLGAAEASAVCGPAARAVAEAIAREMDGSDQSNLVGAFEALSGRLGSAEAAPVIRAINEAIAREKDEHNRSHLVGLLASVCGRLGEAEMVIAARSMALSIGRENSGHVQDRLANELVALSKRIRNERAIRLATTILQTSPGGTTAATIQKATESNTFLLTTQELVDLLKVPTCFGKARRVVLDQLENIHGRRFANHWEFVRFAREKGLKLDFTSPPRRPDPKASLGRSLDEGK